MKQSQALETSLLITADWIVLPDRVITGGAVVVADGLITDIGESASLAAPAGARRIEGEGLMLSPGLLDIQINGGFGHDFTHEPDAIWDVGSRLPAFGVTGFIPAVVTSIASAREAMLATLADGAPVSHRGAAVLGTHFEGPFINPGASGAHDPAFLRSPREAEPDVARWSVTAGVRMVTLAPELDGALDLARDLVTRGVVVSAGHSTASYEQALAGFDAGLTYVTHLFNAMPPLGHRAPGLVGAALSDPRVAVGLIADGIHVHPAVVRLAAAAAGPSRLSLVTDATAGLGMAPGRYLLGGRDVVVDASTVRLAEDGRLAGSALTADEAVRGLVSMSGWAAPDALGAVTAVPARLLGLSDRGQIRVGSRADLTLFTSDLHVVATFVGGQPVYGPWD